VHESAKSEDEAVTKPNKRIVAADRGTCPSPVLSNGTLQPLKGIKRKIQMISTHKRGSSSASEAHAPLRPTSRKRRTIIHLTYRERGISAFASTSASEIGSSRGKDKQAKTIMNKCVKFEGKPLKMRSADGNVTVDEIEDVLPAQSPGHGANQCIVEVEGRKVREPLNNLGWSQCIVM
jgi:hypothetical protein